ncbi:MAG TPA: hypothetical protein VJ916_01405 [Anaerovoracaceae bacterium]|nr:hypothetical protein [Anaerovoracaceae bacterium]
MIKNLATKSGSMRIIVILFGIIIVLISSIALWLYFRTFGELSSDGKDWAFFGTYISGTIGVLISLANLIVFIYVSHLVSKLDKKIFRNQIRYDSYKKMDIEIRLKRAELLESQTESTNRTLSNQLKEMIESYYTLICKVYVIPDSEKKQFEKSFEKYKTTYNINEFWRSWKRLNNELVKYNLV